MNNTKISIIAEIGVNHNGSFRLAKKLIDGAVKSGADYVKFQTYVTDELITKQAELAPYQKKFISHNNQYKMLKKYELKFSEHYKLYEYCKKKIKYLSSPFDLKSAKFLVEILKLKIIKVPSGEITNYFLLDYLSKKKIKIILSTGASSIKDIRRSIAILKRNKFNMKNLIIFHCNSAYPTPYKDVNLKFLNSIKKIFKTSVGYSDHTLGLITPILAYFLEAEYVEKHITLNKNLPGPDHKSSLDIDEFSTMVKYLRNINVILGKNKKIITSSEKKNQSFIRKYLVAKKNIFKNEQFNFENLTSKRTGLKQGLSPIRFIKVKGKKSRFNFLKNDLIRL